MPTNWYCQSNGGNVNDAGKWKNLAGDIVYDWNDINSDVILTANGKTDIGLNVSFTCYGLSNSAYGGTAGGNFIVTASVSIVGSVDTAASHCITFGGAYILNLTGNVTGSSTTSGKYGIYLTGGGTVNITGNVLGGASGGGIQIPASNSGYIAVNGYVQGGSGMSIYGILNSGNANNTITVNNAGAYAVKGGVAPSSHGIYCNVSTIIDITGNLWTASGGYAINNVNGTDTTIHINGNITTTGSGIGINSSGTNAHIHITNGGVLQGATGAILVNSGTNATIIIEAASLPAAAVSFASAINLGSPASATLTFSGSVYGGSAMGCVGIQGAGTGTFVLTAASVFGGSVSGNYGISLSGSVVATITADIYGSPAAAAPGFYTSTATVRATIIGNVYGGTYRAEGAANNASTSGASEVLKIKGNLINSLYAVAVYGAYRIIPKDDNSNYLLLYDNNEVAGKYPIQLSASQVLKGIVHGDRIGTLSADSPFRRLSVCA